MKGKKSFSEDLESVFHQTLFEDNLHDNPTMLLQKNNAKTEVKKTGKDKSPAATDKKVEETKSAKVSKKSFSDNIDIFFKESIEEALEDTTVTEIKRNIVRNGERKAIGIDVLLQRTAAYPNDEEGASLEPMTKRVTFVLDVEKITRLKEIAREENKQLRHIVSNLIEQYIHEHLKPATKKKKK